MRSSKKWLIGGVGFVLITALLLGPARLHKLVTHPLNFTRSAEHHSYFYRLKSSYMHGDERVDFDIVVGCNVVISAYKDGDQSFDALRYPNVFVKETRDHGAVLQMVPEACAGQTTENGDVPKDLLPGAIWFDKASDLSLGYGYITEDAFDAKDSPLRFLGATISTATKEDWDSFQPINRQNLIKPERFTHYFPPPSDDEVKAHLFDKAEMAKWWPAIQCYGVARYRLSDSTAREELRRYWPEAKPRYWAPASDHAADIQVFLTQRTPSAISAGLPLSSYFIGRSIAKGFPTHRGGGTFDLSVGKHPAEIFPMKADDGVPWATPALLAAPTVYRDFDIKNGFNSSNLLCYSMIPGWERAGSLHIPGYQHRLSESRVDGVPIELGREPAQPNNNIPSTFFGNDDELYLQIIISLT